MLVGHTRFVAVMEGEHYQAGSEQMHYDAMIVPCEAGSTGPWNNGTC